MIDCIIILSVTGVKRGLVWKGILIMTSPRLWFFMSHFLGQYIQKIILNRLASVEYKCNFDNVCVLILSPGKKNTWCCDDFK